MDQTPPDEPQAAPPPSLEEAVNQSRLQSEPVAADAPADEAGQYEVQPDEATSPPLPVSQMDESRDDNDAEQVDPGEAQMSWRASEYVHHQKRPLWYAALIGLAVVLLGVGVVTRQWSGVALVLAMTAAILVYARKVPRVLNYSLMDNGIMIESKFYPYNHFRSFAVITDVGWHTIDLDPIKRFMPRLTILFEDSDLDAIAQTLSSQLPRVDRQPDVVERLTKFLKF